MERCEFVACRRHSVCYENMIFFFFKDRMNHLESQQKYEKKKTKHAHDAFGGNEKGTSQKRLLLLTCVCCAYMFKTLNMVATSDM